MTEPLYNAKALGNCEALISIATLDYDTLTGRIEDEQRDE